MNTMVIVGLVALASVIGAFVTAAVMLVMNSERFENECRRRSRRGVADLLTLV